MHGHRAQRFAQFVHAVFPDRQPLPRGRRRSGGRTRRPRRRRPARSTPIGSTRPPRAEASRRRTTCSWSAARNCSHAASITTGRWCSSTRRRRPARRSPRGTPKGHRASARPADAIHHPGGDLKKLSQGNVRGYRTFSDGSSFVADGLDQRRHRRRQQRQRALHAESGRELFRGPRHALRRRLVVHESAGHRLLHAVRRRVSAGRAVPRAGGGEPRAGPRSPSSSTTRRQDSYFITVDPQEIAGRDNGSPAGWVRTGYRFLAYSDPAVAPAGAQPVCRLYAPPPYGDTRFYSASPQECASMLAQPGQHFVSESAAAFYIQVPDAAGHVPGQHPGRLSLPRQQPRRRAGATPPKSICAIRSSCDGGWTQEGTGSGRTAR